jgi:dihydropyrimidine dehydrogenase (NAD+) subunit PreT
VAENGSRRESSDGRSIWANSTRFVKLTRSHGQPKSDSQMAVDEPLEPRHPTPAAPRLLEPVHPPLNAREAVVEASACLQCGGPYAPAPCTVACPASIDVPGFIREIASGQSEGALEAARIIFQSNILGGSCARVCPVEELCQGACVLHKKGRRAIEIGRLQRFATDTLEAEEIRPGMPPLPRTGPSIGIVGAGPAGLACAAEMARLGCQVTVYERRPLAGGLVVHGIAPYKQLVDPMPAEVERIRRMGVEFRYEVQVGRDITAAQLRERHHAVFLGVGMGADVPVQLPGEELEGVWNSLEFIERIKAAAADPSQRAPMGQRLVVIGGGNTAIDVAREAVRMGILDVTMVYRRDEAQMPGYRHEIEAAKAEGVQLMCLAAPVAFLGQPGGRVLGVRCVRMQLGEPDGSGRPRPVPIAASEFDIQADIVVKAIGQQPLTRLFEAFGLEMRSGRPVVNDEGRTSQPWCYAGGDCINGGATVVEAVRDGKLAAAAIHRQLSDLPKPTAKKIAPGMVRERGESLVHVQGTFELSTAPALCKGCELCIESCPTQILHLSSKGKIVVSDVNRCVFCGLCEDRCPDFAIWLGKGNGS